MTRDEILSLSPAQLRVEVAKAKGFEFKKGREWWSIWLNGKRYNRNSYAENMLVMGLPDWPNDIAAVFELEGEITELQDQHEYANILYVVIRSTISEVDQQSIEHRFALIHATAEQRCRAWLMWKEAKK